MTMKEMSNNTKERPRFFDEQYEPLQHFVILADEKNSPLGY